MYVCIVTLGQNQKKNVVFDLRFCCFLSYLNLYKIKNEVPWAKNGGDSCISSKSRNLLVFYTLRFCVSFYANYKNVLHDQNDPSGSIPCLWLFLYFEVQNFIFLTSQNSNAIGLFLSGVIFNLVSLLTNEWTPTLNKVGSLMVKKI